jgi:hypothetical protein
MIAGREQDTLLIRPPGAARATQIQISDCTDFIRISA